MDLAAALRQWRQRVDQALDRCLPPEDTLPFRLHRAMRYAVFNGGKRIRPALVYATGEAVGADPDLLDAPACAVELIHAYSLVHDDLPAMDDDDLRRGQPTVHRAFDEATAILAGDALQALALQVLVHRPAVAADRALEMADTLCRAAGSRGMAGGQAIDLEAVGRTLSAAELENMHIHKTGALIRASVRLGALCALPPDSDLLHRLDHYAKCIGLAFQIQDDVLDVAGDTARLGKASGADRRRNKPTYPEIMGLDAARELARELVDDAVASLDALGDRARALTAIARYVIHRDH